MAQCCATTLLVVDGDHWPIREHMEPYGRLHRDGDSQGEIYIGRMFLVSSRWSEQFKGLPTDNLGTEPLAAQIHRDPLPLLAFPLYQVTFDDVCRSCRRRRGDFDSCGARCRY
jgi:hypothetical protein